MTGGSVKLLIRLLKYVNRKNANTILYWAGLGIYPGVRLTTCEKIQVVCSNFCSQLEPSGPIAQELQNLEQHFKDLWANERVNN